MKLRKILALLMCLVFAMAVMTGCGGSDDVVPETEDLSAELNDMFFTDEVLIAGFDEGLCVIADAENGEPINQGTFTWDGEVGTIDGDAGFVTFTIEEGDLVMEDADGGIYVLPYVDGMGDIVDDNSGSSDVSFEEGDENNVTLIQQDTWGLGNLEYTFMPGGILYAYNTDSEMSFEGSYTWDAHTLTGVLEIEGDDRDFYYADREVVVIDDVGDEYHMTSVGPAVGMGGISDDGRGSDEGPVGVYYLAEVQITFNDDGSVVYCMAGEDEYLTGYYELGMGDFGTLYITDGEGGEGSMDFEWDGEDVYVDTAEDGMCPMTTFPDPIYFDPDLYPDLYE